MRRLPSSFFVLGIVFELVLAKGIAIAVDKELVQGAKREGEVVAGPKPRVKGRRFWSRSTNNILF